MKKTIAIAATIFSFCSSAYAEEQGDIDSDALSGLVKTKIYTASKKEEDLHRSPSATYVITEADLKQMGVRHWPDALRSVPGIQVSKINSSKWVIASRGFGEQFSNKLLVLIDDRPIYTTLFSGVLWDQQDIPIDDIKQIEVIRGPGAALWGSNAVNGVINVITKSSNETSGNHLNVTTGITDGGHMGEVVEASHTGLIKGVGSARTTLRLNSENSYKAVSRDPAYNDEWQNASGNFRYDSAPDADKSLSVKANVFANDGEQTYVFPTLAAPFATTQRGGETSKGGYVQGNLTKNVSKDSQITVRSYLDYTNWKYIGAEADFANMGLEAQYDSMLFDNWETVSGVGYKLATNSIDGTNVFFYSPDHETAHFLDAFFQTKIPLVEKKVFLTLGSKVETNTYDPFELSPSAKLSWEPSPLFMSWVSASQAHRIPSQGSNSLTTIVAGSPGGYVGLVPNKNFDSEDLTAYEAGVRVNPLKGLHVDTSVFHDEYSNLRTFVPGPAIGTVAIPRYIGNYGAAKNQGIEIAATYQTSPRLRLNAAYSHHEFEFSTDPSGADTVFLTSGKKSPRDMWNARASYEVIDNVVLNGSVYYSSSMPAIGIPAYTKVDTNLSWSPMEDLEFVVGVDNATDSLHPEYSQPIYGVRTEAPRLYYVTLKIDM
ncbi:MAG: TonB-dependent receptor [Pseudomonadota bacterium]